jgi:hypothetical protein
MVEPSPIELFNPGVPMKANSAARLFVLAAMVAGLTSTTLADFERWDSQISFSVTHGWSAFGGADHGWQDIALEGGT